jgi:hypothetical protein
MKLDKETVIKQRFWFALGFFFLLWVIAFFVMKVSGAGEVKAKQDAYTKSKKEIEGFKNPKNDRFVKPWNDHKGVFEGQKNTVWEKAWELQKEMVTWPWPNAAQSPKYPSDPLDRNARAAYESTYYKRQFIDPETGDTILDKIVTPVEFKGGVDAIVGPIELQKNKPPLREEIWLAQEDFWVKRELLNTIRDALDAVRKMTREEVQVTKEDRSKGVLHRYRFRNESAGWELDLRIEPGEGKGARQLVIGKDSTIKNIHPSRRIQALANPRTAKPLAFRLRQGQQGEAAATLVIEGEPLPPGGSMALGKPQPARVINLRQPFEVEQIFEWENCPIRRIDAIELVKQSHRTATMELKESPLLKEVATQDAGPAAEGGADATGGGMAGGMAGGPMPGGMAGGPGPGMPGMPGGPGGKFGPMGGDRMPGMGGMGGGVVNPTPLNGLERNRYISATEQCRHLPLGMVLVVDQSYVPDVLTAIANSPLRIQITQVDFRHIPGIQRGEGWSGTPGETGVPRMPMPGGPGGAGMKRMQGVMGPMPRMSGKGGGFMPGPGPGRGANLGDTRRGERGPMPRPGGGEGTGMDSDTGEEDSNLVELAVYGVAALYERYPPKPKEERPPGDTSTPAVGGAPAGPAAAAAPAKP